MRTLLQDETKMIIREWTDGRHCDFNVRRNMRKHTNTHEDNREVIYTGEDGAPRVYAVKYEESMHAELE